MDSMNPHPDDVKLAARLRESRPSPPLPPRFEEAVWRKIDDAEAKSRPTQTPTWLDALAALILRPRFAVVTVTVLVLVGATLGVYKGVDLARRDAQSRYVVSVAPNSLR